MVDSAARREDDDGFTIIEVVIAMMVFAVVALGVAYSTLTTIRMTGDARAREVAANLAAGEVDALRAAADPFTVYDATRTVTVDGNAYIVTRRAGWVSATGTSSGCGTGTGTLLYKRVNVAVSWAGRLNTASAAHADTILAPNSRINDPGYGSVLVSVLAADGTGSAGASVSLTPTSGGAPVSAPIPATDADGCAYAFKVAPGTYRVGISRAGSVDQVQQTAPTASVTVNKGEAVSASFTYDYASRLTVRYAPDAAPAPYLPAALEVSYFSASGLYRVAGLPAVVSLYPFGSGYTAVAGSYVPPAGSSAGCVSVDPGAWKAGTVSGKSLAAGSRLPATAAAPSGSATIDVPMALLAVTGAGSTTVRVTSAVAAPTTGDPGCAVPMNYTYTSLPPSGEATLAVPYGSWAVEEQTGAGWVAVPPNRLAVPTNAAGPAVTTVVVTLDPRRLG